MGVELARRLRLGARALVIYAATALIFQYLIVLVFRSLDVGTLGPMLEILPPGVRAIIGTEVAQLFSAQGFLAFVIAFASGGLAGEIERRTIAVVLVRRVTRPQFVGGVALVLLLGTVLLMAVLWGGTAVWPAVYGLGPVNLTAFAWVAGTGVAVLWALAGVALLASASTSESGRAAGLGVGFALASYLGNYLANLSPEWAWLKPYSMFSYWEPQEIIRQGGAQWADLAIPLAVAVFSMLLAVIVFARRDIAV
jgi:ABC-type transport system involved in multi-copper enzyme maturation permease subunit